MNIQEFISNLFPQASEEQTKEIASNFLEQDFHTVQQLKAFSQEEWRFFDKLPLKVLFRIKNGIKALSNSENGQKIEQNMKKSALNENPQASKTETIAAQNFCKKQYYLGIKQIDRILSLLNRDMTQKEIVQIMDAEQGSPKEEAILDQISIYRRPPKQYPKNAKRITPRYTKEESLPLYHYQGSFSWTKKYYTFLVVGETGSGKTTLLDALVNKLNGMEYKDNWRWRLVDESHLNKMSSGKSKTSKITVYYINDIQNKFNIRIIDTPGFGDTSGIKVDNEITDQFEKLFNEIDEIDYILLTIKASETRLRHGSKYIYDRVQQLFGKDAKDHFILMCTFADDKEPNCLQVVEKQIHYSNYFTFNNSALYTPPQKGNAMTKLSWKMGMESIQRFSQYVIECSRTPLSLQMSQQVLENRKYLQQSINASQKCLKKTLIQLDIAKNSFKNLQDNRKKIEQNGTYEEQYLKTVYLSQKLPRFIQMCSVCNISCCLKCEWPQNQVVSSCSYFTWKKGCPICPSQCPRQAHVRTNLKITKTQVKQKRTIDFKKQFYEQGIKGAQIYLKQFDRKANHIRDLVSVISDLNEQIKKRLKELEATALKPKVFTDQEYYRQMIKAEEETKEEGWTERVKYIQAMIQKLQTTKQIQENNTIYDLIPDLQEFESQIQQVERGMRRRTDRSCAIY